RDHTQGHDRDAGETVGRRPGSPHCGSRASWYRRVRHRQHQALTKEAVMGLLADAIANGPNVKKGPPCSVGAWLARLDDETRAEAQTLMADDSWQHTALNEAFSKAGLDVATPTLTRHRKGEC